MTAGPPAQRTALVIDTDPGIDDVVCLALAARSPEVQVVAVTTTYGNATLSHATRNATTVLGLVGRPDIPVRPGADRPLARPLATGTAMHGPSGVGYAPVAAAPPVAPNPAALLDVLVSAAQPVTLLTLGPLTNLAHAFDRDAPAVRRAVRRHIAMLGAFAQRGAPERLADFNAWADPEAADSVLSAGLPTTLVPLDVTRRFTLGADHVAAWAAAADPLTRWLGAALRYYVEAHRAARGLDGCVLHDVLTLGEVLAPGLLSLAHRRIGVDLDADERRGHTRERENGVRVQVATGVDVARLRSLLGRVFRE